MTVDDLPQTMPALFDYAVVHYGERPALIDGAVRMNFVQLNAARRQAAKAFIGAGLAKGDRVAIWAPNIHEFVAAASGLQSIGGVLVPLNTRFKGAEAGDILRRSKARLLLTVGEFLGVRYPDLLAEQSLSDLERIVFSRSPIIRSGVAWS